MYLIDELPPCPLCLLSALCVLVFMMLYFRNTKEPAFGRQARSLRPLIEQIIADKYMYLIDELTNYLRAL